jgi:hypothetical protein
MNINWVVENKEFLGIVTSFLVIVVPFATFVLTKNKEQKQINFERFHKDLTRGLANLDGKTGLDQQVAIIYEMRNYPQYYPVIRRILLAQITRWKDQLKSKPHFSQLISEAEKTINYTQQNLIKRYIANWLTRFSILKEDKISL